ncbi:MAG: periplasmic heavy metal sensor [Acidobacteriota bacterium]
MSIRQIRKSILTATAVGAIAVAGLFAGRLSADAFPHGGGGDFAPRMFGRIARALDLTPDQKTQIHAVLKAHAAEITAQVAASKAARQALRDAVLAPTVDEAAIRARAADAARAQADGAVLFARIHAEIEPSLTAEQKEKLRTFHARVRSRGEHAAESLQKFLNSPS